jgi:CheY-like chemotaxis protein
LAGGVAHDFNNLLGVISNYASFAADDVAQGLTAERGQDVREDIAQIQRAAQQAAGLTQQLLAFARHEIIQPAVLNLNDVVTDVEHLLVRTLGEHIELITDLADGLNPVLADRGQIEQVLVNLAVNARDAMPGGGKLAIQTVNTDLGGTAASQAHLPPGPYVAVKVSDTGTGMPREVMGHAFELFFTTKAEGEGSGLGLATVHGIITQAGGGVRISSEPGLGTTVTALLPVTERGAYDPAPPPTEAHRGHGETVLVTEDEPAMREITRRILARNGYHVVAVASGRDALAALSTRLDHIDVLLTDVIMPGMQGKELADKVRILAPAARVLFMSGYTQGLLSAQGVLEPGCHLIEKPFSEAGLLTEIYELLDGQESPELAGQFQLAPLRPL